MTELSDLIDQIRQKPANNKSEFVDYGVELDIDCLAKQLQKVESMSPKRYAKGLKYLPDKPEHDFKKGSNRVEEHLAIALWYKFRKPEALFLQNGNKIEFLDHQVPLKSVRPDKGVGKVDILGLIDDERLAIIELKVKGGTPLGATLEALVYAAMIKANMEDISKELQSSGYPSLKRVPPEIIILGRSDYWKAFNKGDQNWRKLKPTLSNIARTLSMTIQFIELEAEADCLEMGYGCIAPKLPGDVKPTVLYSSAVSAI